MEAEAEAVGEAAAATVEAMYEAEVAGVGLVSSKGDIVLTELSACFSSTRRLPMSLALFRPTAPCCQDTPKGVH